MGCYGWQPVTPGHGTKLQLEEAPQEAGKPPTPSTIGRILKNTPNLDEFGRRHWPGSFGRTISRGRQRRSSGNARIVGIAAVSQRSGVVLSSDAWQRRKRPTFTAPGGLPDGRAAARNDDDELYLRGFYVTRGDVQAAGEMTVSPLPKSNQNQTQRPEFPAECMETTMTRRTKGEGNVRERPDGLWETRATFDENGQRVRKSFYGPTAAAALKKLRAAQRKADDHLPIPSERLTVNAYFDQWLEGRKATLAPESHRRYVGRLDRLRPHIGHHKLVKLQPEHLEAAYTALGREVSGTTVALSHGTLHTALRDAMKRGKVSRNVASLVDAPRRSTKEFRALSPADARDLLAAAKDDPLEAFYTLALTTGARLGELQAVQWADFDAKRARLQIRRTLAVDGKPIFSATTAKKNHNRTVWLSASA